MNRLNERVITPQGQRLRLGECQLEAGSQFVLPHERAPKSSYCWECCGARWREFNGALAERRPFSVLCEPNHGQARNDEQNLLDRPSRVHLTVQARDQVRDGHVQQ